MCSPECMDTRTMRVPDAHGGQKRASGSLDCSGRRLLSSHVIARREPRSVGTLASTLNC